MPPAKLRVKRECFGLELRRGLFDIRLDGTSVESIAMDNTVDTVVEPGRHVLQITSGRYRSRDLAFEASAGELVNFRCHGAMIWPTYVASIVMPNLGISLKKQ